MEVGKIEIDTIEQIAIQDITHNLAVESGFNGVIDLVKVEKHGSDHVYLIRFHDPPPKRNRRSTRSYAFTRVCGMT